jgi:DNA repair exonuclease SbcCD ATPase subunit
MTKFLGILFGLLVIGMCGLCAKQWVRETELRTSLKEVEVLLDDERGKRHDLEEKLSAWEKEIKQLTQRIDEQGLKIAAQEQEATATKQLLVTETARADLLQKKLSSTSSGMEQSKEAIETQNAAVIAQNEAIKKQNATIEKQNQMLKDLAAERDGLVEKTNTRMTEFNDLMKKYNELAAKGQ